MSFDALRKEYLHLQAKYHAALKAELTSIESSAAKHGIAVGSSVGVEPKEAKHKAKKAKYKSKKAAKNISKVDPELLLPHIPGDEKKALAYREIAKLANFDSRQTFRALLKIDGIKKVPNGPQPKFYLPK